MKVIKEGFKAFSGGFCGCLGAWAASLLLIIPLILVLSSVVGPAIGNLLQGLPGLIAPLMGPMGAEGPPEDVPTCEGLSPDNVSIWLTKEDNPEAERFTVFSTTDDIFVWVQGPEGCAGYFALRGILPNGQSVEMGPGFYFDPAGAPLAVGNLNREHQADPGSARILVVSGGVEVAGVDISIGAPE